MVNNNTLIKDTDQVFTSIITCVLKWSSYRYRHLFIRTYAKNDDFKIISILC